MISYYLNEKQTRGNKEFLNLTFSVSFCTSNTEGLRQIAKIVELAEKNKVKIYGTPVVGSAQYNSYTMELTEDVAPNLFRSFEEVEKLSIFELVEKDSAPKDTFFIDLEKLLESL